MTMVWWDNCKIGFEYRKSLFIDISDQKKDKKIEWTLTLIDNDNKRILIEDEDVKVVYNEILLRLFQKLKTVKHEIILAKSYEVKHLNVEYIDFNIPEHLNGNKYARNIF